MRFPFGTNTATLGTNATGTNDQYVADTVQDGETLNVEKAVEAGLPPVVTAKHPVDDDSSEHFSANAQDGVKKMQATTSVWSRNHLIAAYVMMWIICFVDSTQQNTTGLLTPYVTSAFEKHSLTAYTGVMSGIIGGVLKLPLAKVLDIFGRPQGYALMIAFMTLGLIMMAACNNVQTFAAAQIFYWIGYNGLSYTLSIFVADTSSLKNRGLMFGYISSPYIITVWIAGPLATAFNNGIGWRWSFGAFTIIQLVACLPLYFLFTYNYKKAIKAGLITPTKSGRTFMESVKYYTVEFDVGGLLLLMGGLVFFLLPFSLFADYGGYNSAFCIAFWVIGILMLIGFALYEKYVAPKTFIPFKLLLDRTVMGACILSGVFFVSWYIWHNFFGSFLQVVNGLNLTETNYVLNIYSIGACFWSVIVGLLIRWTGRFKWAALYFGVPISLLGVGLLIHFRQPDVPIGFIVMTQIFIAFGGAAIVITQQVAAMAATDHQHVAVVLALEGMFSSIGGGIGGSIASAVWQNVFPAALDKYLPEAAKVNQTLIYGDLNVQLAYAQGTETRHAIEAAYGDAQKWMNLGGFLAMLFGIPAVLVWRNINVKDYKQVKGRVA